MRLKASHIRYIADKIARDLVNANYVEILTNDKDIIRVASKYLEDNINTELAIEEKAKRFIDDNIDMIESNGADDKRLFSMIKRKFADDESFILTWDDRYSNLSHKIMDELIDTSIINFSVSEMMIKNLIFKSINTYAKSYKDIEENVIERIKNYKKKLLVGTEEYDLVFEKMYEEELKKQGFL